MGWCAPTGPASARGPPETLTERTRASAELVEARERRARAAGEIHGLVGENGCGKSTLIKLVAGIHEPDPGSVIELTGQRFARLDPATAKAMGVQVICQDLSLFPNLTVAENVAFDLTLEGLARPARRQWMRAIAAETLARLGFALPLEARVEDLAIGERQIVAIARGLAARARILFMDEPTASLTRAEVRRLEAVVRQLASHDIAIVFVSHPLDEIVELADRVTVLRDGRKVGTFRAGELDPRRIGELMTGLVFEQRVQARPLDGAPPALEVEGLERRGECGPVSFSIRAGEVLGLGGLLGGLGSLVQAHRVGESVPNAMVGGELNVLAACVLGGASLTGGRGTVGGVLLSILLLAMLQNGLNLLGVSPYFFPIVIGLATLSSTSITGLAGRGRRRLRIPGTERGLLVLLAALLLFSALLPGRFAATATLQSMMFQLPEFGLLALAMVVPLFSGGINLAIIATTNQVVLLAAAGVTAAILGRTAFGLSVYMIGSNLQATRYSGVDTRSVLIRVYLLSSVLCWLAACLMMARFNSASAGYAQSYLLVTILAAVLGGIDPFGGFGRVTGLLLALFVLQVISSGFNLLGLSQHLALAIWGLTLLAVMAVKFLLAPRFVGRAAALASGPPRHDEKG